MESSRMTSTFGRVQHDLSLGMGSSWLKSRFRDIQKDSKDGIAIAMIGPGGTMNPGSMFIAVESFTTDDVRNGSVNTEETAQRLWQYFDGALDEELAKTWIGGWEAFDNFTRGNWRKVIFEHQDESSTSIVSEQLASNFIINE